VPVKSNPLGKINYLSYCQFFTKFTAFTEEDSGHIGNFRYNNAIFVVVYKLPLFKLKSAFFKVKR